MKVFETLMDIESLKMNHMKKNKKKKKDTRHNY